MRHLIPISGKDSLATALIQTTHEPDRHYEFFFNDTGCELPETYEWLSRVENKTGWEIQRIGFNLEDYIKKYNGFLPSSRARYCTKEGKIKPMQKELKGSDCTVYYGLRADENRTGYVPWGDNKITPRYPLQDHGIDIRGVWAILTYQGLLPPTFFWQEIWDRVSGVVHPELMATVTEIEKYFLFAGRSRANCYFCFFQRQYEIVWLIREHPDLAQRMAAFEGKDEQKPYSWTQAFFIDDLINDKARQEQIIQRRVNEVAKYINSKAQLSLPFLETDNELSQTSCGLTCGK